MDHVWHIYKINFQNGKSYIGLTRKGAIKRFKEHCDSARSGSQHAVHRAIKKYGQENCILEILTECYSEQEAVACEKGLICAHNTFLDGGNGYNMTLGGEFGVVADEILQRRIAANIGKHSAPHKIARLLEMAARKRGVKLSAEVRANMSQGHIGVRPSKETIEKRKKWWVENKHNVRFRSGYKHTEETLEKMRTSARARTDRPEHLSEETKDKMSAAHKTSYEQGINSLVEINKLQKQINIRKNVKKTDRVHTDEAKARMKGKLKGIPKSEEHKAKLKQAQKERWARFREERAKLQQ